MIHIQYQSNKGNSKHYFEYNNNSNSVSNTTSTNKMINIEIYLDDFNVLNCKIIIILTIIFCENKSPDII